MLQFNIKQKYEQINHHQNHHHTHTHNQNKTEQNKPTPSRDRGKFYVVMALGSIYYKCHISRYESNIERGNLYTVSLP